MQQKKMKIHEKKGQITLIELPTLENRLPVSNDTYLRIVFALSAQGFIKLPGQPEKMRESRQ
jgi:hypothetical protein